MPYRYETRSIYKIDWNHLFEAYDNVNIFDDEILNKKYFYVWKNLLIKHDAKLIEEIIKPQPKEFADRISQQGRVQEYTINNEKIYVYLDAFRLCDILSKQKTSKYERIKISDFNKDGILYNNELEKEDLRKYKSYINIPVIAVYTHFSTSYALLIDGSHRVAYAKQNNIKDIKVIFIAERSLSECGIFFTYFDYYLFTFLNEYNKLIKYRDLKQIKGAQLAKFSFLSTGKIFDF